MLSLLRPQCRTAVPSAVRRRALLPAVAVLLLAQVASSTPVAADANNNNSEKLRSAVTVERVRAHQLAFQQIADANGGNRYAGLAGHDASANYVAGQLQRAGYQVSFQEFTYDSFFERTSSRLAQQAPGSASYMNGRDFRTMTFSGSGDVTARVTPIDMDGSGIGSGCETEDFDGFSAGDIALIERGGCTFRSKALNAMSAGAAAVLVFNHSPGLARASLGGPGVTIPALDLTNELGAELVATPALVVHVKADTGTAPLTTRNVLAETATGDPNNVVMVGAHLDSVNAGPGINDNGSGSAAVLETAIQTAKVRPRNKVRFAWWSGEESGLLGSKFYVSSLTPAQLDQIALYLNFDMVGSPNFVRFVYDGDNSTGAGSHGPAGSEVIEGHLVGYFQSMGLASEPTPFNGRSDYGPFIAVGIPSGGLFTGAEGIKTAQQATTYGGTAGLAFDPCYHAACDTYANNSDVALDQMSDGIANAVITYAQNTEAVNQVKGKGNFKRVPVGVNGNGAGGGGGLHDDDHDEVAE